MSSSRAKGLNIFLDIIIDWYLYLLFIYMQRGWLILELKFPLLQLINKYTSVAFMQIVRTRISFSGLGQAVK